MDRGVTMVKKIVASLSAVAFAFFVMFGVSHAETLTSGNMFDTFQKKYKQDNYDYQSGSLSLQDYQTFQLSQPITVKKGTKKVQVSIIRGAVAHFKTVRDGIFFKDWKEYAYYAPKADAILTEGDVMTIKAVQTYESKHPTSVKLELGPIVGFMLLIIIIPIAVAFFWSKTRYSTLEFRLKNNLLEPDSKK